MNDYIYPLSFRWRPEIDILLDQLAVKMCRGSQVKKAPIKTTDPQEFSLTKPKTRSLPMPELIPQQEKHKPVSIIYSYIHYFLQTLSYSYMCFLLFLCETEYRPDRLLSYVLHRGCDGCTTYKTLFCRYQIAPTGLQKRCR